MKIDESGMNALILGMPLASVLAHAGPVASIAEPPTNECPGDAQSAQPSPSSNPTRRILWLAMGIFVATGTWLLLPGSQAPEPKASKPLEEPRKVEQIKVPALEPLPPLPEVWTATPAAVTANPETPPAHLSAAADPEHAVRPTQKKVTVRARPLTKANPAPGPIGHAPQASVPPASAMPKDARPSAVAPAPERIDGAAIGIISASKDKLVMSVDGSFRTFRPGERLPFNEVLVSVRNGTITTDRRVIELAQQQP